jgi:hypothetical protein
MKKMRIRTNVDKRGQTADNYADLLWKLLSYGPHLVVHGCVSGASLIHHMTVLYASVCAPSDTQCKYCH